MQGIVAGNRNRGKPRQRGAKYITYTFATMATASRVADDSHQSVKRHLGSDVQRRVFSTLSSIVHLNAYLFLFDPHSSGATQHDVIGTQHAPRG